MPSIEKALLSLDGLSVGDGFGHKLGEGHTSALAAMWIEQRQLPPAPWVWTDDTQMAISIVEVLADFEGIAQDALAESFAERFEEDPFRGYGAGALNLLSMVAEGYDWREIAPRLFPGGSYGNGGAMRAAPIGGYFAGDPERAVRAGKRSAMVTHAHPEGQVGAMAVAAAGAIVAGDDFPRGRDLLGAVAEQIPESETRDGIHDAMNIPADNLDRAIRQLGTGWRISAMDTVPFCLWCAAHHADDYAAALWTTAAGAGDRDTTCAIVGGIVALSAGVVPPEWLARRELLPDDFAV